MLYLLEDFCGFTVYIKQFLLYRAAQNTYNLRRVSSLADWKSSIIFFAAVQSAADWF